MTTRSNPHSESLLARYFDEPAEEEHPSMVLSDEPVQRVVLDLFSGTSHSLPYALLGHVKHEPGDGLWLEFSSRLTFVLRGLHLERLFEGLNEQRVARVREGEPAGAEPDRVCVVSIEVVD